MDYANGKRPWSLSQIEMRNKMKNNYWTKYQTIWKKWIQWCISRCQPKTQKGWLIFTQSLWLGHSSHGWWDGNYVVVTTSENDDIGRPKMAGTINGGFYLVKKDDPPHYPSVVIAVEDINESIKKYLLLVEKSSVSQLRYLPLACMSLLLIPREIG